MDVKRHLPDSCDSTRSTRCWGLKSSGPPAEPVGKIRIALKTASFVTCRVLFIERIWRWVSIRVFGWLFSLQFCKPSIAKFCWWVLRTKDPDICWYVALLQFCANCGSPCRLGIMLVEGRNVLRCFVRGVATYLEPFQQDRCTVSSLTAMLGNTKKVWSKRYHGLTCFPISWTLDNLIEHIHQSWGKADRAGFRMCLIACNPDWGWHLASLAVWETYRPWAWLRHIALETSGTAANKRNYEIWELGEWMVICGVPWSVTLSTAGVSNGYLPYGLSLCKR